jgi:RNA polymerase sigma-70 factor (ECF subfamily)
MTTMVPSRLVRELRMSSPSSPSPAPRGALLHLDPDGALWDRVVAGEPGADAELVRRHQAFLMRFVSRMLGANDPTVDDVVQMTFIAALADPHRFDGRASVRSWLLGIAHNKARMAVRSRARRQNVVALFGSLRSLWSTTAPPRAEAREIGARIQEALETLDPDRRAVFLLVEVEGMTAAEAAKVVGAPAGTVRRWRVEAKERLQPQLADLWPEGGAR